MFVNLPPTESWPRTTRQNPVDGGIDLSPVDIALQTVAGDSFHHGEIETNWVNRRLFQPERERTTKISDGLIKRERSRNTDRFSWRELVERPLVVYLSKFDWFTPSFSGKVMFRTNHGEISGAPRLVI